MISIGDNTSFQTSSAFMNENILSVLDDYELVQKLPFGRTWSLLG